MQKRDWLLLAISDRMEPIQVQKTLFKFAKEAGASANETYDFEPYNWGPCSFEVYGDLERLRNEGLIQFEPSGRGWNLYSVTPSGIDRIKEIRRTADSALVDEIDKAREYVVRRGFGKLLHDVYTDYPDYATRSLFRK